MSALRFVREDIRSTKYSPVEPLEAIAREVGIPVEQLVKVCVSVCACVCVDCVPHGCLTRILIAAWSLVDMYDLKKNEQV